MYRTRTAVSLIAALIALAAFAGPVSAAGTLDKIRQSGKIALGYRAEAQPFSYRDDQGNPAGYSVALCQAIADGLKTDLGLANLSIEWVPVTIDDRFSAVQQGKVDLLCSAETETLSQRKEVSFSLPVYPSGIGALLAADTPPELQEILERGSPPTKPIWRGSPARTLLEAQTFSVVANTRAVDWLRERADAFDIDAKIVPVDSYDAGVQRLLDGTSDVLFGEATLLAAAKRSPGARDLTLLDRRFTNEPIALVLARGDEDFRLAVDQKLSQLMRSDSFRSLYSRWFGEFDQSTARFFRDTILAN
jgi:ABC-type amino acid transport/signal transduction systems, periplasmic component/domain